MIKFLLDWLLEKFLKLALRVFPPVLTKLLARKGFHSGGVLYLRVLESPETQRGGGEFVLSKVNAFRKVVGLEYTWGDYQGNDHILFLEHHKDVQSDSIFASLLAFGIVLQAKARDEHIRMTMALHWGNNAAICNTGGGPSVVGPPINAVQRFASIAGEEHFFLSMAATQSDYNPGIANEELGLDGLLQLLPSSLRAWIRDEMPFSPGDVICHVKGFACQDQQHRPHELLNLYVESTKDRRVCVGCPSSPPHERFSIEYRDSRAFVERLVQAEEVCIIGLTHEGTVKYLNDALDQREEARRGFWRQMTIVFPSKRILANIREENRTPERREECAEEGKRSMRVFYEGRASQWSDRFDCLEYDGALPFWGNRFVDGNGASIRVSPILPGADLKNTFYVESFKGMKAYDQLEAAFTAIYNESTRVMEWDICGDCDPACNAFKMQGIVRRLHARKLDRSCVPAVLIVLHAQVNHHHGALLQARSFYNARDNFTKYSNISGFVTDRDVCLALGKSPPMTYTNGNDVAAATAEFWELTGLQAGHKLDDDVWRLAAIREIREELGIEVDQKRLVPHGSICLGSGNCQTCGKRIVFAVFSLELVRGSADEVESVRKWRPYANLHDFDMSKLREYHDGKAVRLNDLLQSRFDDFFVPLFRKIGVSE